LKEAPEQVVNLARLTARMASNDESAYRTFFDLYLLRLKRYLLVVTQGREDAAREALQLTLLRVVRHIRRFESEATFWSWLTVLARSSVVDEERKRKRYLTFLDRFFWWSKSRTCDAHDEADAHLQALLEQGLQALPAEDRQLVEQKYFADRSVKDLAQEHETTEKAVESRLVRIRRKLRETILTKLKHETAPSNQPTPGRRAGGEG
jgi:RNA polymerase sigma-70 factor (ECF subfamily)